MIRGRLLRLFWPLAIWIAVFGARTVGCKRQGTPAGVKTPARPTIRYNYPSPPPTPTLRPGIPVLTTEPQ